jgi:hypothetical protein
VHVQFGGLWMGTMSADFGGGDDVVVTGDAGMLAS